MLLVLIMCVTLCACGQKESAAQDVKSAEVKEVESLIAELPNLPMDSMDETEAAREKVVAANDAYQALSENDKQKVENYQMLLDE